MMCAQARYLVFDGDVDAVWVENMNSVMDDNKLLTLPNGERIRVQPHCKLLFEVADLQHASPATISRCGMVYVDSRMLGAAPFAWSWLQGRRDERERAALEGLFDKYVDRAVRWVLEGADGDALVPRPAQTIPVTNLNIVQQLTVLLAQLLGPSGSLVNAEACTATACLPFGACSPSPIRH
jgi:dynein heavy chain, axonemal